MRQRASMPEHQHTLLFFWGDDRLVNGASQKSVLSPKTGQLGSDSIGTLLNFDTVGGNWQVHSATVARTDDSL